MGKSSLWLVGIGATLGLQACTLMSDVAGCRVKSANERGGIVTHVTQFTEIGALTLADAHCAQYGRVAQNRFRLGRNPHGV